MKKKDPEIAKQEAEQNKRELAALLEQIKDKTDKVPQSVIDGSHQLAVAFKTAAARGVQLLNSKQPTLKAAREAVAALGRFA